MKKKPEKKAIKQSECNKGILNVVNNTWIWYNIWQEQNLLFRVEYL